MSSKTSSKTDTRTEAELRELIAEGATDITADDLRAARDRAAMAALQGEAATRAAIRQAAEERAAAVEQLRADVVELAGSDVEFADLAAAIGTAVETFAAAVDAHNDRLAPLVARATALELDTRPRAGEGPHPVELLGGNLRAADARVVRRSHGEVAVLVRAALDRYLTELRRAHKAAQDAAAPPVALRRFRGANGTVVEVPADRPLPYGTRRALELGDLVELDPAGPGAA